MAFPHKLLQLLRIEVRQLHLLPELRLVVPILEHFRRVREFLTQVLFVYLLDQRNYLVEHQRFRFQVLFALLRVVHLDQTFELTHLLSIRVLT